MVYAICSRFDSSLSGPNAACVDLISSIFRAVMLTAVSSDAARRLMERSELTLSITSETPSTATPSTTGSQKKHSVVQLFRGITADRARPTREALRGLYAR